MLNRQIFFILSAIVFTVISCNQGLNYNVLSQKANHNQDNLISMELKSGRRFMSTEQEFLVMKREFS